MIQYNLLKIKFIDKLKMQKKCKKSIIFFDILPLLQTLFFENKIA